MSFGAMHHSRTLAWISQLQTTPNATAPESDTHTAQKSRACAQRTFLSRADPLLSRQSCADSVTGGA